MTETETMLQWLVTIYYEPFAYTAGIVFLLAFAVAVMRLIRRLPGKRRL